MRGGQELVQKLLEAGVQFGEMSRQQAENAVKNLVKAGEIRRSETEAMVQSLMERGRATAAAVTEAVQNEVSRQLGWLANRVDDVEDQLEALVTRLSPDGLRPAPAPVPSTPDEAALARSEPPPRKRPR
jgi:polyhydroxyalkanoate synthesis regulator phasin